LECGSKAELVAAVALLSDPDDLLICNGYKDDAMLGLILDAQMLGQNVLPVIEKHTEFVHFHALATERGMTPRFGVRLRLNASSAGHWADSSGDRSKFGVSMGQLFDIVQRLRAAAQTEALALVHCHLGSQIPDIMTLSEGVRELAQVYVQLVRESLAPSYLDIGGGLGVNYDAMVGGIGEASINYTLQEYADTVVSVVAETCAQADVPVPTLVSESGRAMTAHHSVLVVPVLGAYGPARENLVETDAGGHPAIDALTETLALVEGPSDLSVRELLAAYHEAVARRRECQDGFRLGLVTLAQRARVDALFFSVCSAVYGRVHGDDPRVLPEELVALGDLLADQYLCDFSVFQSMLDHWAIGQRFPIMPLHRLDERPERRAVLVDLTCDSDGKVRDYVSHDAHASSMDVHALRDGQTYYLGFFLMGAYQDIMGDAHNLFGRVAEIHVYADDEETDGFYIETVLPGAKVRDMLEQVQYFANDLERRMSDIVRRRVNDGKLRPREGVRMLDRYRDLFASSPYLAPAPGERAAVVPGADAVEGSA
ncbi:MAG: biosynthetic arginine decarboxylase, partial [Pseudomonadota bacterium]